MYLEKLSLKGRVAVVTGGGQGIGAACARALAEAGATVVVADMAADRGARVSRTS
jgi:NAD(P)-dependent dehydrogenase (short-subunit alcohol dehydrogenase family)